MDRISAGRIIKNAVIFSEAARDPLIASLAELMLLQDDKERAYRLCCDIARELYPHGDDLTDRIYELISLDDNFYIKTVAKGEKPSAFVETQLNTELDAFACAASCTSEYFSGLFLLPATLPSWRAEKRGFVQDYAARCARSSTEGWGDFARYGVFTVAENGSIAPVSNPDGQSLGELYGYENEREKLLSNTLALLNGKPANNVLLYGDAGTGKSSTVKAVANGLRDAGLRLIQVEKSRLHHIPALLNSLADNPLKFIIFIDDLSFESDDRDFTALKTVLEGGVAARAGNIVIYATSNRRHLIRESMEARKGDEVHLRDTLEESASLAARFGIVISFSRPDREQYRELVLGLAKSMGLAYEENSLMTEAEAWAIRAGGRTPRAAKQFVEYKVSNASVNADG